MQKRALITGIAGQDGSYLAEYLLAQGYKVFGIIRRNSVPEHQESRIHHLDGVIETFYGDVLDYHSIAAIMKKVKPDEVYNLASQSHVGISFQIPIFTCNVNAIGALHVLEAVKEYAPSASLYQASSSEMFGNSMDEDGFQRETTPMRPTNPYGCAKLFAYSLVRHYRRAYGLFACNGILFNHSSPRRGSNFVEAKVVKAAIRIAAGKQGILKLGRIDSKRDWGHSKDYVRAMHMILNHTEPDDFVVATGQQHSVRELCWYVFTMFHLDYEVYVVVDVPEHMRAEELVSLKGDSSKIRRVLGWEPSYTFESLILQMIEFWKQELKC